jgi:antirestriction protein ArdC
MAVKKSKHMPTDKPARKDFRQEMTDNLVSMMELGQIPWNKPWKPGLGAPVNAATGKAYRGANRFWLQMAAASLGSDDLRFCTFKQAEAKGWRIKKGSKAVAAVEFWQFDKEERTTDPDTGQDAKNRVRLERPRAFASAVFHASQIEGIPDLVQEPLAWDPVEVAEAFVAASGACIEHGGDRAYYSPMTDHIQMPPKEAFASANGYYSTTLHELGHWTGHESRLARDLSGGFGSESYAKEELRAELFSIFMQAETGITHDATRHAAYLQSWLKVLKEDKNEIFRAAHDAESALDFVRERVLAKGPTQVKTRALAHDEGR